MGITVIPHNITEPQGSQLGRNHRYCIHAASLKLID